MIILGISDMSQDSSACVVRDGKLLAAVSEERVSRVKHCGGFPDKAIREVLRIVGLKPEEVDRIAVGNTSAEALMRLSTHVIGLNGALDLTPRGVTNVLGQGIFTVYRKLLELPPLKSADAGLSQRIVRAFLRKRGFSAPVKFFDHHLSHAASAFYTSGFRKALILSLDGYGDGRSGAVFLGDDKDIEELASISPNVSLGAFYGTVTTLLGYRFGVDEGKTMALAAFGEPSMKSYFEEKVKVNGMSLRGDLTRFGRLSILSLASIRNCNKPQDIAASAQALLEETSCGIVENALEQTGLKNLCFAGGVALNVKLNQRLMELPAVRDIHVFPAPSDEGTAVGAAFLLASEGGDISNARMLSAALGTPYSPEEIRGSLVRYISTGKIYMEEYDADSVAEALSGGQLVAWFDGRMEFGPRALGRRSILADPQLPTSPARIRRTIKKRPVFQPFCPSVTPQYARELLVNPKGIRASFMTLAFSTRPGAEDDVPAVVHVDGSCRPQIVRGKENSRYYELLRAFGDVAGVEGLLNTSLNRSGEPIVRSPEDALDLFLKTDLDLLVMGDHLYSKKAS